jgi:hypothetical protein
MLQACVAQQGGSVELDWQREERSAACARPVLDSQER